MGVPDRFGLPMTMRSGLNMRKRIHWLLVPMLCGVSAFAAGTTENLQGRQETFAVARQMQGNGRVARNHRYLYRIAFRDGGIAVSPLAADTDQSSGWTWGLRLTGYGTPDHIQAVADAQIEVSGTRLEYRRGVITEWYENKPAGLEQGFTLHEAPAPESTDVVLILGIEGDLRGEGERSGQAVGFLTESGRHALSYGDLRVTDADGKRIPARLALGPDRLEIHLQARGAKWPIVVDPLMTEPGEPILDWIAADYLLGQAEGAVEIPVSWSRFYGEPALIAQYWLNDTLVLTRALHDEDAQSGSATLVIDEGGEYEVTVALCNMEGCSASDPLLVSVVDPEQPFRTAAAAGIEDDVLSFDEAAQIVEAVAARLAVDSEGPTTIPAARAVGWGLWFASFVGQAALKYGLNMGFDALLKQIGLSPEGPDLAAELAGIDQSLGEIKTQLDEISSKIDVGKADSDFKNSHRLADVAMQNIKTIAGNIAAAESGLAEPTQFQLESWAKDNRDNIAALRSLLVNSLTGAVPLMLDYYQLRYPVSSGMEVRAEVDGYLNGFRAALGVGLLNQAWLTDAFAPNGLYDAGASSDASATVAAAYGMVGAPYLQPPSGPPGFIHRIGTDWALIDEARPMLVGENARAMTQTRSKVRDLYITIAAGVNAPGGLTIADYMDENGIKRVFNDPNSVRVDSYKSLNRCEYWVRYEPLFIVGNTTGWSTVTTWNWKVNHPCGFVFTDPYGQAHAEKARVQNTLSATEKVYSVNVPTNNWGMPALMNERSITGYRDGIDVEAVTRQAGNAVTLTYDANGYDWIQISDPATDVVLFTGGNQGRTLNLTTTSGAVEIVQGDRIENREGEDSMQPMERAVVTANPGSTLIDLTLDPS